MKRNLWPYAIVGYFILFITAVVTWVIFAMHHEDQLVRPDYYEHEIRFQEQLDRMNRTAALPGTVKIAYHFSAQTVSIAVPASHTGENTTGTITLYRPSDARLDQEIKLALDEHGSQTIDVARLQAGLWKVRLSWTTGDLEYYFDQPVILASN